MKGALSGTDWEGWAARQRGGSLAVPGAELAEALERNARRLRDGPVTYCGNTLRPPKAQREEAGAAEAERPGAAPAPPPARETAAADVAGDEAPPAGPAPAGSARHPPPGMGAGMGGGAAVPAGGVGVFPQAGRLSALLRDCEGFAASPAGPPVGLLAELLRASQDALASAGDPSMPDALRRALLALAGQALSRVVGPMQHLLLGVGEVSRLLQQQGAGVGRE